MEQDFSTISNTKQNDTEFVVAITSHRFIGFIMVPYLIKLNQRGTFYTVDSMVLNLNRSSDSTSFTPAQNELLNLLESCSDEKLTRLFSRARNSKDFFQNLEKKTFDQQLVPYIDKKYKACIEIIAAQGIKLFFKPDKSSNFYTEDLVEILPDEAETVFNFDLRPERFTYKLHVEYDDKPISLLKRLPYFLVNDPCHMVLNHRLYRFRNISAKKLQPFIDRENLEIPLSATQKYMKAFVLNAIRGNTVDASGFDIIAVESDKKAVVVLEEGLDLAPMLTLKFHYGKKQFLAGRKGDVDVELSEENGHYTFYKHARDMAWEKSVIAILQGLGLRLSASQLILSKELNPLGDLLNYLTINWLNKHSLQLQEHGIDVESQMDVNRFFLGLQQIDIDIKNQSDWFDVFMIVSFGEFKIPFYKLRNHILKYRREFELPDGQIAILPLEWFAMYTDLLSFAKANKQGGMALSKIHFALLSELPHELPKDIKVLVENNKPENFKTLDPPPGLNAVLRSYQQTGYSWLYFLGKNGFGACLADDMGLGKTLQTLALLLLDKHENQGSQPVQPAACIQLSLFAEETKSRAASLIVLPTSLVHNWYAEIGKFAPSLKTVVYTGLGRRKIGMPSDLVGSYDLILTTYGVVRNDIDAMKDVLFNYIILDESQYIKNPDSKIFQAVCELNSHKKMVLTGTPVENSLTDLWSQLHFLNPELLGSLGFFKEKYQFPIEKDNCEQQRDMLQKMISPFILRRKKEEVARDLPPLTEQVIYCTMEEQQRELYEEVKSTVRNKLLESMNGQSRSHWAFLVIQAMTRLRQLANHPFMVGEPNIESGKFNSVMELLHNLVAEKHKVLVFSSFVKHLKIFEAEFARLGWGYCLLTGQTTDRKSVIADFQQNEQKPIFLISLKAGGVGLNLTAADYILMLDPWWNPAAEAQAVSRAHRIGQEKKVFVYKFITEESIEEKMMKLKEQKLALADQFVNTNNPLKSMSDDELKNLFD